MPTIDYVYFDTYPDHSEITHELCVISDAEWKLREEQSHKWESDGRMARREISVFDSMMAEIMDNRNAEKARVRNRRKADRKHKVLPKERKHQEEMRKDRMFGYYFNENCPKVMFCPESLPIRYRRDAETERGIRSDWEREQDNHYEAMQEMALNYECAENYIHMAESDWICGDDLDKRWELRKKAGNCNDEARHLWNDEEYFRKQKSIGIDARIYLGISYKNRG